MTGVEHPHESPLPLLTDPRFELHASGSWSAGGLLEIRFANMTIDSIDLSTSDWSVLALLIKAGQQSADDHWTKAFMKAKKLARELRRRAHRGSGSAEDVHRAIHRIRKLLDGSLAPKFQPRIDPSDQAWAKRLIEQHANFGYRISLLPGQLYLTELEDDTETDPTPR